MTSKFGGALSKLRQIDEQYAKPEQLENLNTGKLDAGRRDTSKNLTADRDDSQQTGMPENLKNGNQEYRNSDDARPDEVGGGREKYSTYIDGALITRLKLYAVRHRLKHREVVESAISHYLDHKEKSH